MLLEKVYNLIVAMKVRETLNVSLYTMNDESDV